MRRLTTKIMGTCAALMRGATLASAQNADRSTIVTFSAPDDVSVLNPTQDPTLALVTCYPFNYIGAAPKRFIVQAERAPDRRQ